MFINTFNIKVWFQRLSFIGELGWEIYIPIKKTKIIFEKIKKLGKKYKITYSGMHALDTLRLEKKFLHWGHYITSENNPFEAGLTFAVNFKKDWTRETLFYFLGNPKEYIKGTKMIYKGLKKKSDRVNLISYLESLK